MLEWSSLSLSATDAVEENDVADVIRPSEFYTGRRYVAFANRCGHTIFRHLVNFGEFRLLRNPEEAVPKDEPRFRRDVGKSVGRLRSDINPHTLSGKSLSGESDEFFEK